MYPKIYVLYIREGTFHFEERDAQGEMSSTSPHDFGLTSDCEIILVMFKATAQAVWLNGMRRAF